MMISTRGRYALRILLDLAENQNEGYIAMKTVAQRQELSLKYIERIMPVLSKNHYVEGVQGKGGGYRLTKDPKDYRIGDILNLQKDGCCLRWPVWNVMQRPVSVQIYVKHCRCGKRFTIW